jgi:hypothetical protein
MTYPGFIAMKHCNEKEETLPKESAYKPTQNAKNLIYYLQVKPRNRDKDMFVENNQHKQLSLISSVNDLPEKHQTRLDESWAGTFYHEFFCRIDESPFAVLYSDLPSRPNIAVNVLLGLEVLKAAFGWTDEELMDAFIYNMQVRYALGIRQFGALDFEIRTLYNFRRRVAEHMQKTGVNLIEEVFKQVTAEQMEAYQIETQKLRMDSTLVTSNIRNMSRLQLLVEVLQRVHRMLDEGDQDKYKDHFSPYLEGTSGQFVYRLKGEEADEYLQEIGLLMHKLLRELQEEYGDKEAYHILARVFSEHFEISESQLRPKENEELSASSLQSPDDWEATYRRKNGEGHRGYVANVTETCDPENELQMITNVQVEPNTTDDAAMLEETIPDLVENTEVEEIYVDGGYGSPQVDEDLQRHKIDLFQTAIRGRKPSSEKLYLSDFLLEQNEEGDPIKITCPHNQTTKVEEGRKDGRYLAYFEELLCAECPLQDQCPAEKLQRKAQRVLRFSGKQWRVAKRRRNSDKLRESGENLRSAVEATIWSVVHPFPDGKVPVRGQARTSMMIFASAIMSNVRRIHRFLREKENQRAQRVENRARNQQNRKRKDNSDASALSLSSLMSVFNFAKDLDSEFNFV